MELRILMADGRPAADAVLGVAEAPVPVPDLGCVADAQGRLQLPVAAAGHWRLRIWHAGRCTDWAGWLAPGDPPAVLRLGG